MEGFHLSAADLGNGGDYPLPLPFRDLSSLCLLCCLVNIPSGVPYFLNDVWLLNVHDFYDVEGPYRSEIGFLIP